MKALVTATILFSFSLLVTLTVVGSRPQVSAAVVGTAPTPVIVELFTSEGCSSCPPADALLAGLAVQQPIENVRVIALEEHVDYWNEFGWVDPFSSHDWTARQYVYAGLLGNGNPYTPQMVVDGRAELVGNQPRKARQAISDSAKTEKAMVTLIQENAGGPSAESLAVKVGKLPEDKHHDTVEVWLAITEEGLHSAVKRGENAGSDLHHAAVVRTIRKIGEAKAGEEISFSSNASVLLQKDWNPQNVWAVVFVQEKKRRRILGAAEIRAAQ